jgi:hypothetical protein
MMTMSTPIARSALGALILGSLATPAAAQEKLAGFRTTVVSPVYETWSFADDIFQPTASSADSVRLERVSQWSFPVMVFIPLGRGLSVDVAAAYASGEVKLDGRDAARAGTDHYSLSGITDAKIRLTGRLAGDNLLFTLGFNAPSGKVKLDDQELNALRVLAAPALNFQIPTLGTGSGGTAGLVFAKAIASWAWAFGASYEIRSKYAPATVVSAGGLSTPDFNPSDAIHLSLGSDGLVGAHGMTFGLSADIFTEDKLIEDAASSASTQLGPIYTAEWQLRVASRSFRELTFYAIDRYRSKYKRDGATVPKSDGNYVDAGVRSIIAVGAKTGVLAAANVRHHTGLKSDNTLATAALASGGLTLGLSRDLGSGYLLQPFARGQIGRVKTGVHESNATGVGAGVTLTRRF